MVIVTALYFLLLSYISVNNIEENFEKVFSDLKITYTDNTADYEIKDRADTSIKEIQTPEGDVNNVKKRVGKTEYELTWGDIIFNSNFFLGNTEVVISYKDLKMEGDITPDQIKNYIKDNKWEIIRDSYFEKPVLFHLVFFVLYFTLLFPPLRDAFTILSDKILAFFTWTVRGKEDPMKGQGSGGMLYLLRMAFPGYAYGILIGLFAGVIVLWGYTIPMDFTRFLNITLWYVIWLFIIILIITGWHYNRMNKLTEDMD